MTSALEKAGKELSSAPQGMRLVSRDLASPGS